MTTTYDELLRGAGLRVTAPRRAVLGVLATTPHTTADEVRRAVPGVSTQAVYDVLHALTEKGIVRRIEPAGSAARFELRVGDNHHHLVCRGCGRIEDVDCATGAASCLTTSDDRGFAIDEAEVTFWGTCPTCREDQP